MSSARGRRQRGTQVLADGWFSWLGRPEESDWVVFTTLLGERLPRRLAERILARGALRGLALALASGRYGALAMNRHDPGWRTVLLARALLGRRRKLVVLQFFDHAPAGLWGRLWSRIDRWALSRSLLVAQVLTPAELAAYPQSFGLPAERFTLIRFAARTVPRGTPAPAPRRDGPILAAGRAHCDWETLFRAGAGRHWPLQVVCSREDHARVQALEARYHTGAQISCELAQAEAHALLADASISVICVSAGLVGRGHIRIAEATDAGAAILASDVASLHGYLEDGHSGMLVPAGDPEALAAALDELLGDPPRRAALAAEAFSRAEAWTGEDYVAAIHALAAERARRGA